MPANERRFFLCTGQCVTADKLSEYPHSHILGELRYVRDEGRRVTALAVWNISVPAGLGSIRDIIKKTSIRLEVIGDARGIKCTHPGCLREERWEIGKAAFLVLMQRYERRVTA
jgi:hypothetical protein